MPNKPENAKYRLYLCAFVFYHAGMDINDEKNKTKEKQAKTNTGMKKCRKVESEDVSLSLKVNPKSEEIKPDQARHQKKPKRPFTKPLVH